MTHAAENSPRPSSTPATPPEPRQAHFLEQIVEADNAAGKWGAWTKDDAGATDATGPAGDAARSRLGRPRVHTRFPPEPNGYLHIGHSKAICLNHGLAAKYGGKFNLRFDDTNPSKEEQEYVDAIIRDVKWLGCDFDPKTGPHGGGLFFASDYFGRMYEWAVELVKKGKAYVCELPAEEVSRRRGAPGVPATSPHRDRPAAESLRLLAEMKDGKHPDGAMTLRAKIDLASPNFNLRDPVMYRIVHAEHHNTGTRWSIYPMYDWAHGLEDSIEGITHSICTLEFENNRPLYDWFIDAINEGRAAGTLPGRSALRADTAAAEAGATGSESRPTGTRIHHPQQIEFARLNLTYTVMSKRFLLKLVQEGHVRGWDDPRMPTLAGYRRRGYTPESIRAFAEEVGVTRTNSVIDVGRLENAIRGDLNRRAPRAMAVLRPLKVVIENWDEGKTDELEFVVNPEDASAGKRKIPFGKVIYIERDDFMEDPPKKFFRLSPGSEVRLRWAYFLKCTGVVKDTSGNVTELRATIDPATRGGDAPVGPDGKPVRKVQGTIHWVSAAHAVKAEVRLYDRLFKTEEPGKDSGDYLADLNPGSLEVVTAFVDPALAASKPGDTFQFERLGYFCADPDTKPGALVFNRTVTLKDTWAKVAKGA